MRITFTGLTSEGERIFYRKRAPVFPDCFRQVEAYDRERGAVYFSMQDRYDVLETIRRGVDGIPGLSSALYLDTYLPDNWYLEIFSSEAGKDKGVQRLREKIGGCRVVAFGDNTNDLPLFAAAEKACAMGNATPEAKQAADEVIGANTEDGVAEYLLRREGPRCFHHDEGDWEC